MICEKEYQSVRCWEFSELCTIPCQNFTYPHLQMGICPIKKRINAKMASIKRVAKKYVRFEYFKLILLF